MDSEEKENIKNNMDNINRNNNTDNNINNPDNNTNNNNTEIKLDNNNMNILNKALEGIHTNTENESDQTNINLKQQEKFNRYTIQGEDEIDNNKDDLNPNNRKNDTEVEREELNDKVKDFENKLESSYQEGVSFRIDEKQNNPKLKKNTMDNNYNNHMDTNDINNPHNTNNNIQIDSKSSPNHPKNFPPQNANDLVLAAKEKRKLNGPITTGNFNKNTSK